MKRSDLGLMRMKLRQVSCISNQFICCIRFGEQKIKFRIREAAHYCTQLIYQKCSIMAGFIDCKSNNCFSFRQNYPTAIFQMREPALLSELIWCEFSCYTQSEFSQFQGQNHYILDSGDKRKLYSAIEIVILVNEKGNINRTRSGNRE